MNRFTLILCFVLCTTLIYAQNWVSNGFTPGQEIGYEQNGNTIWKLTSNNIYKSTNGGATWNQNIDFANAPFYQEDYLPFNYGTIYPFFDADNSRVHGDFMLLALRTDFSNRDYWTTPDAGQTFSPFTFDGDFFVESYNLGNNRYLIQVADYDNTQASFYRCKWYYSDNGGQSFSQILFDYGRYSRLVGTTNTSFIIHNEDKIHYHNFSNFNLTQSVNLPDDCEAVRVDGATIQAVSYDVENSQSATALTLYTSNNGGASFSTVNNTKPTGFIFDLSVVDNYLFFFENGLYRYDLNNFSNPPTVFASIDTPHGPFKKTLDGQMVNTQPKVFAARFEDFNNPFYTSSNHWTTIEATEKIPFSLEAMVNFGNTNTRFYGNHAYMTTDGKQYTEVGDFFGSALKSDVVYLDDAMWISTYSDPSATAYFSNDGVNFKTTNEFLDTNSNFPGDAEFYQAGNNLIARSFTSFDPEFLISADNGNSWTNVPNSGLWGRSMFTDTKNGTLYGWQTTFTTNGASSDVYFSKSTDNGVAWNFIESNFSNLGLSTSVYNGTQWMAYNNHLFARTENDLLISSDGGLTFNAIPFPNSFYDACVWIDNGTLHVDTKDEKMYTLNLDQWLGTAPAPTQDGYQVDVELSIRLEPANPTPYSDFDVIVTLTNTGNFTANNINVREPFLNSPVAVNRGAENPTYSTNFNWTNSSNNSLEPGASATASFPFYRLDGGEIQTSAYVRSMLQPDVDSEPGVISDMDNPEDDEAVYPAPNANGFTISVNCPGNVYKEETSATPPMGTGFTGFGDVILPRPTASTTCPGGITSIEYVGTAPTFQMGGDLWLDGPGEHAIFWEIKDACGNVETCLYSAEVVIPAFVFGFANCPGDIVVEAPAGANGAIVNYDTSVNSDCPNTPTTVLLEQGLFSGATFPIGTTTVSLMASNTQCGTANCTFNVTVVQPSTGSGVDLELAMTQSVDNPTAYNTFTRTVTVTNTGTAAAQSIQISIPTYDGMVLSGGNEFTTTLGTFGAYSNQVWNVPLLGAGQSQEIVLTYYALQNITAPGYAQVIAIGLGQDIDSTPNNGTPPTVNEDDEASTSNGSTGGGVFYWENCPTDITVTAAAGAVGAVVNYTNPTLNTDACPFLVSSSGVDFPPGYFFPIGTTTVNIFAGNGQCGVATCAFNVTVNANNPGPSAGIDLELSMTQSVANPAAYSTFERTVTISNTGNQDAYFTSVSIPLYDGMVFSGGNEWESSQGFYAAYGNRIWNVNNIPAGASAEITLRYYALENITSPGYAEVFELLDAFNSVGQDVDSTPNNGTPPTVNEDDEASTIGGTVEPTDLPDLTISNFNISNNITTGQLTDYSFDLNNLGLAAATNNYQIELYLSNDNNLSSNDIFIGDVKTGNTFPGTIAGVNAQAFVPSYVSNGAYTLIVEVDVDNDIVESNENNNIISLPVQVGGGGGALQGADIELSVQQSGLAVQYDTYTISYTASNTGTEASSNVQVTIPVPTGVVLSGGDEYFATKGTLGVYFDNVWRIGSLSPGESVDIDINYYKLSTGNVSHYAQVSLSAANDPDSTPNNGQCCIAIEDDEASLTAVAVSSRALASPSTINVSNIDMEIYPNPAMVGEDVFVHILSDSDSVQEILIYDLLGEQLVNQKVNLHKGNNKIRLQTDQLVSGMFFAHIIDSNYISTTKFILKR